MLARVEMCLVQSRLSFVQTVELQRGCRPCCHARIVMLVAPTQGQIQLVPESCLRISIDLDIGLAGIFLLDLILCLSVLIGDFYLFFAALNIKFPFSSSSLSKAFWCLNMAFLPDTYRSAHDPLVSNKEAPHCPIKSLILISYFCSKYLSFLFLFIFLPIYKICIIHNYFRKNMENSVH